ncbi:adenylate/guanylate cyclase domain-containing protein [Commensalibacter oyaizuii]|uniref:Cache domain-containing protein n=1 Tax=Commensalibacter oyaizuii TaxID=3043873 RepID=A0ABT6PYJ5_9PROT|nr:adenylate/guanylate cyclase domain-containing protein [Commensalibacter sp. TBRC 16381]MDI2089931.1 cache domain-containing protein [Commensalibacter sp. TBRC 16381]
MPAGEVVDPTKDPVNRLWRLFLRVGVPVLGVVLVVIVVVGVTLHSYRTTKAGILKLTHVILKTEQSRVSQEVLTYLNPATIGGSLAVDMLSHIPSEYKTGMFYTYVLSSLRQTKQIQSFYLADADGNFTMVERTVDDPDRIRIITLKPDQQGGRFLEEYMTLSGKKISTSYRPANAYDPRLRSWYKQAMEAKRLTWSPPVLMASKQGLVVTASIPFVDRDGRKSVLAVNISLQQLTTFLSSLNISPHSQAIIVDRQGNVIASPDLLLKFGDKSWKPQGNKINPDSNPIMARAYDQFLVHGVGIRSFHMERKDPSTSPTNSKNNAAQNLKDQTIKGTYISITSQLPESVQKWVVLIVIPEDDFSNFAVTGGKQNLLFSLLAVALAAGMAGLLIYQGHRMDRLGKRFKYVQTIAEHENSAIEMVTSVPEVFDPNNDALILTEGLCQLVSARRVSVWQLSENGKNLLCNDLYDAEDGNHAGGIQFSDQEIPNFLAALKEGEIIEVKDASQDKRVSGLYRLFMKAASTQSLLVTPVLGKSGVIGAVIIEDSPYARNIHHITKIFAGLVGIRLVAASVKLEAAVAHYGDVSHAEHASSIDELTKNVQDDLLTIQKDGGSDYILPPGTANYQNIHFDTLDSNNQKGLYPEVAVMNIAFSGYLTSDIDSSIDLIKHVEELVIVLQDIAKKYGLFYVKMVGEHIIAVAGCTKEPDVTAPIRLAHAALDMRAACMEMIPGMGSESNFGIGIDVGPAIGSWLGKEPKTFTLWGPTVGMSALMASMAKDGGTIQVTQSAYLGLRNDFLFRSRGSFFIPKRGISHAFILAGRR